MPKLEVQIQCVYFLRLLLLGKGSTKPPNRTEIWHISNTLSSNFAVVLNLAYNHNIIIAIVLLCVHSDLYIKHIKDYFYIVWSIEKRFWVNIYSYNLFNTIRIHLAAKWLILVHQAGLSEIIWEIQSGKCASIAPCYVSIL